MLKTTVTVLSIAALAAATTALPAAAADGPGNARTAGGTVESRVGGTGLGLPIARDLLRGHGGEIRLGEAASGTVFILSLSAAEG